MEAKLTCTIDLALTSTALPGATPLTGWEPMAASELRVMVLGPGSIGTLTEGLSANFSDSNRIKIVFVGSEITRASLPTHLRDRISHYLPHGVETFFIEQAVANAHQQLLLEQDYAELHRNLKFDADDLTYISAIAQALSTEHNLDKLMALILTKTKALVDADAGTIYFVENRKDKDAELRSIHSGMIPHNGRGTILPINRRSIAGYVALSGEAVILDDVRKITPGMPYEFNQQFDIDQSYYTRSMIALPMINSVGTTIGVIQLINRKTVPGETLSLARMQTDGVMPFTARDIDQARAVASQAAIAIDNQQLLSGQKQLLESFIKLIANAIDSKSGYTGAHCRRVPVLTEMLAQAACDQQQGVFADFTLNEEHWYELRIAAWLHDCGKIVTPVHIMDKPRKLSAIYDRIETIKTRFEVLKRDLIIRAFEQRLTPELASSIRQLLQGELTALDRDYRTLEAANIGREFLGEDDQANIRHIAEHSFQLAGSHQSLLTTDELTNLLVSKGTLTAAERLVINSHMVETINMLESLPFPAALAQVPTLAGGHHEKMDGNGYPKGLYGGDMPVLARMMAIADVFEALTAGDRPYKRAKLLSETMAIMGDMKRDNHLDPDIFDLFVSAGVYLTYAREFLSADLIDSVDEAKLLAIQPRQFDLPAKSVRDLRWQCYLPAYQQEPVKTP